MAEPGELDAIVLADEPAARVRIAGLAVATRAERVARRVGATRVLVVDGSRAGIPRWRDGRTCPLLVIRGDQVVQPGLVAPLVDALARLDADGTAVGVGPEGEDAGAYLATGRAAQHAITALASGAAVPVDAGAARVAVGPGTRFAIATDAERAAAHAALYASLAKPQDNAITRTVFRPVSSRLTRLLVWTPITPNQVSIVVAVMCAIGIWLTASASMARVIAGTAIILAATYVDCCDGEIARLKLVTSKAGAWLDTIVDELSSIGYMAALGYHCHLYFGDRYGLEPWLPLTLLSLVTYFACMYFVYWNIVVLVGSANSQDYVARVDAVPGSTPGRVRLVRSGPPPVASPRLTASDIVRRDFLAWMTLVLAALHLPQISFLILVTGGVVLAVILAGDHVRHRRQLRAIRQAGQTFEPPR